MARVGTEKVNRDGFAWVACEESVETAWVYVHAGGDTHALAPGRDKAGDVATGRQGPAELG